MISIQSLVVSHQNIRPLLGVVLFLSASVRRSTRGSKILCPQIASLHHSDQVLLARESSRNMMCNHSITHSDDPIAKPNTAPTVHCDRCGVKERRFACCTGRNRVPQKNSRKTSPWPRCLDLAPPWAPYLTKRTTASLPWKFWQSSSFAHNGSQDHFLIAQEPPEEQDYCFGAGSCHGRFVLLSQPCFLGPAEPRIYPSRHSPVQTALGKSSPKP